MPRFGEEFMAMAQVRGRPFFLFAYAPEGVPRISLSGQYDAGLLRDMADALDKLPPIQDTTAWQGDSGGKKSE